MEKTKKNSSYKDLLTGLGLLVVVLAAWYLSWQFIDNKIFSDSHSLTDIESRGLFGDKFGAVNALFSALALAGIIFTIFLQKRELGLQREELQETRLEFKTQNETLRLQRFENTFFNLLNIHHNIVNGIDYTYYKSKEMSQVGGLRNLRNEELEAVTITGRDVFRFKYNKLLQDLTKDQDNYQSIYKKHYDLSLTDFGHYFRHLYRMVKLVDKTDFKTLSEDWSEKEEFNIKYSYTSIIRAQLSDFELLWLFYNCLGSNGKDKFKPLIEKYSLLKNVPDTLIADFNHRALYDPKAYSPD